MGCGVLWINLMERDKNIFDSQLELEEIILSTGFPCCLEVACSYENWHKQKGDKTKEQLPLIYMETFLSIPRLKP